MLPTVIRIGPYSLSSYTLLLDMGILIGLGILGWRARHRTDQTGRWSDAVLVAIIFGVFAARAAYVMAHWLYYQEHRDQILRFWLGGLSWHGALMGILVGLALVCWLKDLDLVRVADEVALVTPLVGAFAWLGCLLSGCSYGVQLTQPHWLATDLPDLHGVWAYRINVQLVAAGWSLLVAAILWGLRSRVPQGMTLGLFLLLYGLGLALIDPYRGDPGPYLGSSRLDVVVDWMVAVGGLLVVGYALLKRGRRLVSEA